MSVNIIIYNRNLFMVFLEFFVRFHYYFTSSILHISSRSRHVRSQSTPNFPFKILRISFNMGFTAKRTVHWEITWSYQNLNTVLTFEDFWKAYEIFQYSGNFIILYKSNDYICYYNKWKYFAPYREMAEDLTSNGVWFNIITLYKCY